MLWLKEVNGIDPLSADGLGATWFRLLRKKALDEFEHGVPPCRAVWYHKRQKKSATGALKGYIKRKKH
ncbi:hypothetical protein D0Q53_20395 [Salmonella enterica]|nr:hypothetical protein [Salmonella enterica]EBL0923890.1 hypothetical protein [Salmonella enterica]